jgi:hypothetical protein
MAAMLEWLPAVKMLREPQDLLTCDEVENEWVRETRKWVTSTAIRDSDEVLNVFLET